MKLIGSRSLGIHNENSDYDYVVIEEGDGNWEDITNERLGNRRHCYHYPKGYRDRISMFNIEQDDYHWMHNAEDYMLGVIDINPFDYREEWVKRMHELNLFDDFFFIRRSRLPRKRVYHIVYCLEALKNNSVNLSETSLERVKYWHDGNATFEDIKSLIEEIRLTK